MKITKLVIGPRANWDPKSETICTIQLASEKATVETVLSDDDLNRVLDLVQSIVADAAERNVAEFVNAIRQVEADKQTILIA